MIPGGDMVLSIAHPLSPQDGILSVLYQGKQSRDLDFPRSKTGSKGGTVEVRPSFVVSFSRRKLSCIRLHPYTRVGSLLGHCRTSVLRGDTMCVSVSAASGLVTTDFSTRLFLVLGPTVYPG